MSKEIEALIADLEAESDLCRNETATDIADLLDRAIAALRQQQGQGEPVAWIVETEQRDGTFTQWVSMDKKRHMDVCDRGEPIPLFTSPPAPAPSRELSDEEILQILRGHPFVNDLGACSAIRAVIAADRAIRPAAGMVSNERSERVIEAAEKMRLGIRVWIESVPEYSMLAKNMQNALDEFDKAKQS